MSKKIKVSVRKINKRKTIINKISTTIIVLFVILTLLFLLLTIIYKGGSFTISIDPNLMLKNGLIMFETKDGEDAKAKLHAKGVDFMDNISIKWLPNDLHERAEGSHNGEYFIAYTFYLKNEGDKKLNYWYEIYIEEVIKNVDEAIRIMVYHNETKEIYAKLNNITKKAEEATKAFYSDKIAVLEERAMFEPGQIDKITVVIWLEGDDPDCVDSIVGGEIKAQMKITEKHNIEEVK